jgi:hypothetical protein
MFVIVASSAKSDIESKECVCLTKVDKIETYFDTTRVRFASLDAKNNAKYELEGANVNYEFVTPLALEFKQTQIIAIMP